ncbi:30248_t:CDS:2, partial [Racocetra persica]
EINRVKNDIDRYKSVGTAIGLNIRKNDSRSKFYLHQVNAKELGHNLHLKYKRLVKEEQVYKTNEEILKASRKEVKKRKSKTRKEIRNEKFEKERVEKMSKKKNRKEKVKRKVEKKR